MGAFRPQHIIDFYGTVEQIGMPYPDCAAGRKHVPYWAEIIVRQPDYADTCRGRADRSAATAQLSTIVGAEP